MPRATWLLRAGIVTGFVVTFAAFWWLTRHSDVIPFLPRQPGAEWIVFPTPANTAIISAQPTPAHFRVEFFLSSVPVEFIVQAAVNREGALFINDQPVDDLLLDGREWKRPRSVAMSGRLVAGTNRIDLMVTNTFGPPAAWLRVRAGDTAIFTDSTWQVSLAGSVWRRAALARARPTILPGNLLFDTEAESSGWLAAPWLVSLVLVVGLGFAWPKISDHVRRWLGSPGWWHWPGVTVGVLWVALAVNNLPQLPRLYGFDVEGHEEYIRFIQQNRRLPLARDGWQMYQPPLYYGLSAAVLNVAGHSVDDAAAVGILRWFSIGIGLAHCAAIFFCLRLMFPAERWKQLVGTLFVAFLPAHLVVSHYVTNENLCAFWVTLSFYFFLRLDQKPTGSGAGPGMDRKCWWPWIACGVSLGLALLTKFTAVLVLPALFAALAWKFMDAQSRTESGWWRPVAGLMLSLVITFGWHYARVWREFGTPLVGNWDAASGFAWWQFPGYRTGDYYVGFGTALAQPLFGSLSSFADGLYSTFWADGLASGSAATAFNPPWNSGPMKVAALLGFVGTILMIAGLAVSLARMWRQPRSGQALQIGFLLLLGLGLIYMTLRVASYAQVKAFYGLSAMLPLTLLLVFGCDWLARRGHVVRGLSAGLFLAWVGLSFASVWVRTGNPQTHMAQGIWLSDRGQLEPALKSFQRALQLAPGHASAAARAVETQLRLGRLPEALALAERSSQLAPNASALRLQLANALAAAGETNRAVIELHAAARLGPHDARPWQFLALRHWQNGEAEQAASAAREALAISPYEPVLHALLGLSLAALQDTTNALWHLEYACRAKPDLVIAQAQLGRILLATGNASDALGPLEVAIRASPNDMDLRRQQALALQQAGQSAGAAAAWRAALSLAPDQPDLLNNLAWLLATDADATVRNGDEAVRLAERACELTGRQEPALLGTLGAAHAAVGQFDRAITAAEAAIRLARGRNQPDLVGRNSELLALYREGKPFVQYRMTR